MVSIEMLLERARVLLEQGRDQDAVQQLQQALQQDPKNDFALSLMGRCMYNLKKYKEGMELIKQAIQVRPDEDYYFYLLAFGHYYTDQNLVAQRMLDKAMELNPYMADYFGLSALIHIEEIELKKALNKANEGLAIDPENITCLNARATALNKLKQTEAAVETMRTALEQNPENEFTHTTIGWNFLEKGRHTEAAAHFREALRIHPNLEAAQTGLKQALKSRIPPYRWLLQYSFWISNKGKNMQWILPVALFVIMRLIISAFGKESSFSSAVVVMVAIYFLFVITSWVINPIANFTLLFNKDGKYALTNSERWSAITSVSALIIGVSILTITYFVVEPADRTSSSFTFLPGLIFFSLALPLSNMQFPVSFRTKQPSRYVSLILVILGLLSIVMIFIDKEGASFFLIIYFILFIGYNWTGLFKS